MRSRHAAAVALVVAASVLAFAGIFSLWLNRQVLNTDNWTATSSELLADPVIRDQVGVFLVDQLYSNVDVTEEIRAALPPRFQPLAGPAAGGLRTLAERASKEILARPRAQQAWEDANRKAHEAMLKILDGGTQNLSTTGGVVVLDLQGLLTQLADRLGFGGRQAAALPAGAAQIEILRSDQLATAQDVAKATRHLPLLFVGLSLALFFVALFVAPMHRRTTVRSFGIGLIAAGLGALAAGALGGDAIVSSLATTASTEPVVQHVWDIVTPLLNEAAGATIGYGLVMVVGAWLAGPTRPAVAVRGALAPYLRKPVIAWSGFAVLIVAVLWWGPTPALRNVLTALLLVALLALGFEGLRRRTAREFPDADWDEAMRAHGARITRARERVASGPGNGAPHA
jgi:hypothetical protein